MHRSDVCDYILDCYIIVVLICQGRGFLPQIYNTLSTRIQWCQGRSTRLRYIVRDPTLILFIATFSKPTAGSEYRELIIERQCVCGTRVRQTNTTIYIYRHYISSESP